MLGVHRKKVQIVPHDPFWQEEFKKEKALLENKLGNRALAIEHVGSTAVPGLSAKPVLDMLLGIENVNDYESFIHPLQELGYKFAKDSRDIRENVLFVKGEGEDRTHHLKLLNPNSKHWHELTKFRDYLITHQDIAKSYEEHKQALAKQFANDRESYTAGKNEMIQKILEQI